MILRMYRVGFASLAALLFLVTGSVVGGETPTREAIVQRVRHDIEYLASDALEGRGIETKGIELAAEHVIAEYEKAGLKPGMPDGSWRQRFPVTVGEVVIAESTGVELTGPDGSKRVLKLGDEFQPVRRGANGSAAGGIVFIGYGITSLEDNWDDFAGVDLKGKIVIGIRREPQPEGNPIFRGPETSTNAFIDRKLELLQEAGAAGLLFVNNISSDPDELVSPATFGNRAESVPFVHVKQAVIDSMLKASPLKVEGDKSLTTLAEVSTWIDQNLKPLSQDLTGWTASIATQFEENSVSTDNILGVVEAEGPLADETIVIGGHYDHLGFGGFGSRSQSRTGEVHNGADDNASGTAAVLELARRIAAGPKPKRRMVFICFSGEERGLIGSNYYVQNPVFPLDKTVAMINFDMIGNLKDNRVDVNGVGTAKEFEQIAKAADEAIPVNINIVPGAFAGSDHLPFYQRNIPVMFCFTGMTAIYHTPDDDSNTLNMEGAVTVIDYAEQLLRGVDALEARPTFVTPQGGPGGRRSASRLPYLGVQADFNASGADGIVLKGVTSDSPAATAGLQTGDVILSFDEKAVEGTQTLFKVLGESKPGQKLKIRFKRGEETKDIEVELVAPRR
jgi:Zn-dependent M28 family amino/carboxypeptidase